MIEKSPNSSPPPDEAVPSDPPGTTRVFVADSAADALRQIRRELGPEAVVLQVRQIPASSFSQLWQKRRVEVVAGVHGRGPGNGRLNELLQRITLLNRQLLPLLPLREERAGERRVVQALLNSPLPNPLPVQRGEGEAASRPLTSLNSTAVRPGPATRTLADVLESIGMLPGYAQRLAEQVRGAQTETTVHGQAQELSLVGAMLETLWRKTAGLRPLPQMQAQVLVGATGVGKTTCLCKWLAHSVLLGGQSAHVWRLDGRAANTAEALSVYGDILGVPVERSLHQDQASSLADIRFIDLPGVDWRESGAVAELKEQLARIENAQIHLVLNAAYETPILLAQVEAFASLPLADLIFTHLDEESRWGKLWNFFAATEYAIAFLSAGQNVPGTFYEASARRLLPAEFF